MANTFSIGKLIHDNGEWLGSDLLNLADEALSADEARNYAQAVIKAGSFLEGLLARALAGWGISPGGLPTLGPLIGETRKAGRAPGELLERLNEANTIRNRAPHHKSSQLSQVTAGDSLQILNIMGLVVEWFRQEFFPASKTENSPDMLPVFLSVGNPHRLDQQQFVQRLRSEFRGLGVELLSLSSGYSEAKPFDQIVSIMTGCRGALVVGLDRFHGYAVFEREKSDAQKILLDQYIPTAWNQIEGSIATVLKLPLLVLRERRLHKEGIFEAQNHRHQIYNFDLEQEFMGLSVALREYIAGWVHHVQSNSGE